MGVPTGSSLKITLSCRLEAPLGRCLTRPRGPSRECGGLSMGSILQLVELSINAGREIGRLDKALTSPAENK